MSLTKSEENGSEKHSEEQMAKINEVRASLGELPAKLFSYSSNASIVRYLIARNWNVKKATRMLKETLKWRLAYKPEEICWDEVANEAETGKIYRSNLSDKYGRSVLVMRPGCQVLQICSSLSLTLQDILLVCAFLILSFSKMQNTKSIKGQMRYLVYCMENAILNLSPDQEQMVWLINFEGFNMSNLSIRVTKETADILQNHYPERLGLAILYNPPKFFEPFWTIVKPFLEPKTYRKVKFVYSDHESTKKIMEDLFNMDELDCAFGGKNQLGFNINDYAARMREDDKRMSLFRSSGSMTSSSEQLPATVINNLDLDDLGSDSDKPEKGHDDECEAQTLDCQTVLEDGVVGAGVTNDASPELTNKEL